MHNTLTRLRNWFTGKHRVAAVTITPGVRVLTPRRLSNAEAKTLARTRVIRQLLQQDCAIPVFHAAIAEAHRLIDAGHGLHTAVNNACAWAVAHTAIMRAAMATRRIRA